MIRSAKGDPSIAILAPQLAAPSQLWMRRQIELLGDRIVRVVTDEGHGDACPPGPRVKEVTTPPWPFSKNERARRWSTQIQIAREFREDDVSVLLVHYVTRLTGYRRVWGWTDKPVFVHCHGYDVTWNLKDPRSEIPVHPDGYVDSVLRLATRVQFIANSRWTGRQLESIGIPPSRTHVKYFGIPTREVPLRRPVNRESTVLYLGRLSDFKGPREVIQSFELAVRGGFSGRLVMAGDGDLREACGALVSRSEVSDRIKLLGAVTASEGEKLRASADIFTAHNKVGRNNQQEAFGVSNLEAMADALPIVGTRSGAVPEVVDDGSTGILVEPGDVQGHAEALIRLGSDPDLRQRMGLTGWRRAREVFSPERELKRFLEIFAEA